MKSLHLLIVVFIFTSISSQAQSKRLEYGDLNKIMTYKVMRQYVQMDSMLREHGFKTVKERGEGHYQNNVEDLIAIAYSKEQGLLWVILNTEDFEYYKLVRQQIAKKYDLKDTNFKLGAYNCEIYDSMWGSFFVGYDDINSFIVARNCPISNYED